MREKSPGDEVGVKDVTMTIEVKVYLALFNLLLISLAQIHHSAD